MDNKFLEEGARILNEIIKYSSSVNDWTINDKKIAIKVIADNLDLLSSKHKEDVRALKTALTLQDSCPDHRDDCTCYEIAVAAFDSTLKDLGIEL